jgi:hypothetical protein
MLEDWVHDEVMKLLDKISLEDLLERLDMTPRQVIETLIDSGEVSLEELLDAID